METANNFKKYRDRKMSDREIEEFCGDLIADYYKEEQLKSRWKSILEGSNSATNVKPLPRKKTASLPLLVKLFGVAAAIALIAFCSILFKKKETRLQGMMAMHHSVPLNSRSVMKGSTDIHELRSQALNYYESRDYKNAASKFEEMRSLNINNSEDIFFLGLSYLYDDNPNRAIVELESILNSKELIDMDDSVKWYLSWAYIANNECSESLPYLREISNWDENTARRKMASSASQLIEIINTEGCNMRE